MSDVGGAVREDLVIASLSVLPGTQAQPLVQRLADALILLPIPAAALIAPVAVPAHVSTEVRGYAEALQVAEAAADFLILVARIYHRPQGGSVDPLELAVTIRELWQQHVAGPRTGLVGVTMVPPVDPARWLAAVRRPPWIVATSNGAPGLLPA